MHLSEIATKEPDKPAVIMSDGSRAVTFAELDRRSLQVSRPLSGLGVHPRDHVALIVANRPEFFEIAWGAQRHGTRWTPVNWHLTAREAQYIVEDCGAQVLFASPETAGVAAQIAERLPRVAVFLVGDDRPGLASYERAVAGCPRTRSTMRSRDLLLLLVGDHGTAQGHQAAARAAAGLIATLRRASAT